MADVMEPNVSSLTGIGVPPNREDSFASAFGEPGVPLQPPQPMAQGTPTESSSGNLAGATGLADRLGIKSDSRGPNVTGPENVMPQPPAPAEDLQNTGEPTVAKALLDELKQENSNSGPAFSANGISETPTLEAASQPVAPDITPDMGGVVGEPKVPAESPAAVGGDITYEDLKMELLEELRKSLGAADEAIKRAKEATDKLGVNPTDAPKDTTAIPKESVGTGTS